MRDDALHLIRIRQRIGRIEKRTQSGEDRLVADVKTQDAVLRSVHALAEPTQLPALPPVPGRFAGAVLAGVLALLPACAGPTPSVRVQNGLDLPTPASQPVEPGADRLDVTDQGEHYTLSAKSLIPLVFSLQPDIKSSYQRFKSEGARYDFFYTARDSLTPQLSVSNTLDESRADETVARDRDHAVTLSLEKKFFDTTEMDVGVGYRTAAGDQAVGNHPFVSANVRYPLWASRERLERSSEEVFRRNELNDAQLAFIQQVRNRLRNATFRFYDAIYFSRLTDRQQRWREDTEALLRRLEEVSGRDTTADRRRIEAEVNRVGAEERTSAGWAAIQKTKLKSALGLPFHARIELQEDGFNPFAGLSHQEVLRLGLQADPEIATLRNAMRNAEVELDLARRGQWDVALLFGGESNLEGRGEDESVSDWSVSVGLEVGAVDSRVTGSLTRQAQANIARFAHAILARENAIFEETLEPAVRIRTLGESRDQLIENLPRYEADYEAGIAEYLTGTLNIDDLLKRRENLFAQQQQIADQIRNIGFNVAELCEATGKFFELINGEDE